MLHREAFDFNFFLLLTREHLIDFLLFDRLLEYMTVYHINTLFKSL